MDSKILNTLEYNEIKQKINRFLLTDNGKNNLRNLQPTNNYEVVKKWLSETDDGFHLYRIKDGIPIPQLSDVTPFIKRLKIHATLNSRELAKINQILLAVNNINKYFDHLKHDQIQLNYLYQIVDSFASLPEVTKILSQSISEDGDILDTASNELKNVRRRITRLSNSIRTRMERYTQGKSAKYLSEAIVTFRDGRYVIPVKTDHKNQLNGIVHDQSSSGETLYIEPNPIVSLNNELRSEELLEQQEEHRILVELSKMLEPYLNDIINNGKVLGHLDLINAKARYAYLSHSTKPEISESNVVNLKRARHPLIDKNKVIANDVQIGDDYKAIIITGPNTGGKTIVIKMLGLIQLMGQSGLFIPANDGSQIGIFDNIFADIGDEQSIEQNLSTFSSHMDNIVRILHHITDRSLVLLDELGAGTDPKEGSSLAIAILDSIGSVNSEVVATTHYPELKAYGYNRPQTINASMEFDMNTLKPTYHLLLGVPGQSNGLNIAERLGLDSSIISQARSLNSNESQNIDKMITELTKQTKRARQDAEDLHSQLSDAEDLHQQLQNKFDKYIHSKERLNEQAKEEANRIVVETKKQANQIIDDLHQKQSQVNQNTVKENELINAKGSLNSLQQNVSLKDNSVLKREKNKNAFHKGDDVLVKTYGQRGILLDKMNANSWKVQLGILKMQINESDMEKIKPAKEPSHNFSNVRRTSSSGMSTHLDLRGERYTEAMHRLDQYIDSALLANYSMVTIIHGKGTGALRKGVNSYLKQNKRVKSFSYSPANAGGDGSTVVKLK